MAETEAVATPAVVPAAPQAGDNAGGTDAQVTATTTSAQAADQTLSVEELRAQLERERLDRQAANKEAKAMRDRLRALEAAEEERRRAAMTEQERTAAELAAAQERLRALEADRVAMLTTTAIVSAAGAVGIRDPQDAVRLIDASAIEYDADGKPTNVESLVKALATAKPYLTTAGQSSPANAGRGGPSPDREAEIRARLYGAGGDATFAPELGGGVFFRPGQDK